MRTLLFPSVILLLGGLDPSPNQDATVYGSPDPLAGELDPKMREILMSFQPAPPLATWTVDDLIDLTLVRFPDIKMSIDKKSFTRIGIDPDSVIKCTVVYPKGRICYSRVLRDCLAQAKCDLVVKGDTILVVPKK
jgi:hypothetical protein